MPEIVWPYFIAGLALCLAGWTLYWVGLHLAGAVLGAAVGCAAAWSGSLVVELDAERMWWVPYAGGACGFAAGIFLMRGLHRFFFFFLGAALGMAVGKMAYDGVADREWAARSPGLWKGVFLAAGSVAGGASMVWGSRWVVALVTSVAGSALVVLSVEDPLALLVFIPLVPFSFFLQIGFLRRLMPKASREEREDED